MKGYFFKMLFSSFLLLLFLGGKDGFAQKQDFEADFQPISYPLEFLPGWFGNDVRANAARIFQAAGLGRNETKGLAVQPISTFDGEIWVRLFPEEFQNPEIEFYGRAVQNGSGTRPALVFYSWGESLDGEFSVPIQLGQDSEFANENQSWRKFSLQIPEKLKLASEVVLRFEIRYGSGSGSAARWLMDDFEFGDFIKDETPPKVIEVKGYSGNSLLVRFSEKLDPVFSTFPIAFELEGKNPEKIEFQEDSILVLSFLEKLEQSKNYWLAIRQIPDLEGNFLQDTTVNFTFSDPVAIEWKALVINELMPAPRADQDLPNVEYIELYHNGDNEYRLEGLLLSNSRSETVLNEFWVKPGDFLILAAENQASQLEEFGKILPVANWPTLLNSGDQISLKSSAGVVIDQVSYSTTSWGGSEFANGGYSLEVPNPNFLCDNSDQLVHSKSELRGTPGAKNSISKDEMEINLPKLETAYFQDSLLVILIFSEPVLSDFGPENLDFSPSLIIDSLIFLSGKEVQVALKSPAESNQLFDLRIFGLRDCLGNPILEQTVALVLPIGPEEGDLIINELLYNPRTGDPKFVELMNTSRKYLRLDNWALANLDADSNLDQIRGFGSPGLILDPEGYLAITTDSNALKIAFPKSANGNFLTVPSLPSYPIAGGTVVLLSSKGEIAESFTYDDDIHHPLLRDSKGVSLERISPKTPASYRQNWQSASGNEESATPGRKNSQAISGEFEGDLIQVEPEIFDPEGSSGPTFTSISYRLDQTGWMGTFKIYSAAGQLIQTLAQNQILGTSGLFTWTGTDAEGKLVRAGYYVLVVELYEPNGKTNLIKKTIVVASRL